MRRILIIGSGGSGKTTVARRLAARTGLPLIHLDNLYWRAGWNPTPADEWHAIVLSMVRRDAWIMDGNYGQGKRVFILHSSSEVDEFLHQAPRP